MKRTLCHSPGQPGGAVWLLLALHLALPYLVRDYLNGKLADMGDLPWHIADVDPGALARRVSDRRAEHRQRTNGAGAVPRRAEHRPVGELAGALG